MKPGDLVRKVRRSLCREAAGLGLVIDVANPEDRHVHGGYKVQWSNDYGTFWTSEDKLEIISETR